VVAPVAPRAPTAGVELALEGCTPTLGTAGASVLGVCEERPLAVVPVGDEPPSLAEAVLVLEAGGATKA